MIGPFRAGADLIIGGDFNLMVTERPEFDNQGISPTELKNRDVDRKVRDRLSEEFGLINCWKTANPNAHVPSTYTSYPDNSIHLDGIFVPQAWGTRLKTCAVQSNTNWSELSDHNPVVAEFA